MIRFGSLFSGIEAASVAWRPLGWRCVWTAEIDPFACALLAHRYPEVPNLGDVNRIDTDAIEPVDLIVFGSPCQSFSVAGKRLGLDDPRGNMALVGLRVIGRVRPRWVVWENVPGVLSSDGGRDFGAFLGLLGELGYGFAYRILDAQFAGVPQRRRRVFVVGYLGDWRPAAAVLFEPESLRGDTPPSREAGQGIAEVSVGCLDAGGGNRGLGQQASNGNLIAFGGNRQSGALDVATAVNAHGGPHGRLDFESETFVCGTLNANGKAAGSATQQDAECDLLVTHSLRADGFDASEDGTGRGTPLVAFGTDGHGAAWTMPSHPSLTAQQGSETSARQFGILSSMSVRRLTARECERLQGFPDDYTLIPYRGKPAADGPRYRAIGNSFAVPVVRWIGERIDQYETARSSAKDCAA